MRDLSTVRGHLPQLQSSDVDVLLLNIHESPGRDLLTDFGFVFSPTYIIFNTAGDEVFRSNSLPTVDTILDLAQ